MGFGHRSDSHGASRPPAKYLWSLAVSVKSSKVSASRHESVKVLASRSLGQVSKVLASWSLGQVSKGLGLSVSRPSLPRFRPLGLSAKSPKVSASRSLGQVSQGLGLSVSRPSLPRSRPLGLSAKFPKVSVRLTGASGSQVGHSLAQYRYSI